MHINRIKTDLICFNSIVAGFFPHHAIYVTLLFSNLKWFMWQLKPEWDGKHIASPFHIVYTSAPRLCVIDKTMCHVDFEWNATANENLATVNEPTTHQSQSLDFHISKWKLSLYAISISKKHQTIWRSVKIFCVLVSCLENFRLAEKLYVHIKTKINFQLQCVCWMDLSDSYFPI